VNATKKIRKMQKEYSIFYENEVVLKVSASSEKLLAAALEGF
jgi:hypothetical protein